MADSNSKVMEEIKMLSRLAALEHHQDKMTYNEKAELRGFLENLLKHETDKNENALIIQQRKQMRNNIRSQIEALKRYEVKEIQQLTQEVKEINDLTN